MFISELPVSYFLKCILHIATWNVVPETEIVLLILYLKLFKRYSLLYLNCDNFESERDYYQYLTLDSRYKLWLC